MHEVSLAYNALDIVLEIAAEHHIKKIEKITFKIGELSGIMVEALDFALRCSIKGTIAEGCEIQISKVNATAKCPSCGDVVTITHSYKMCSRCHVFCYEILSGYELYIDTVEGEDEYD